MPRANALSHRQPAGADFSFFSPQEVQALSCLEITSEHAFAALGIPERGGLYDPRLGPIGPHSCETCMMTSSECPGHWGHVALLAPVYNPLLFRRLLQLLKLKCFACHRFRLPKVETRLVSLLLDALAAGDLQRFSSLREEHVAASAALKNRLREQRVNSKKGQTKTKKSNKTTKTTKANKSKRTDSAGSDSLDESSSDSDVVDGDATMLDPEEAALRAGDAARAEQQLDALLGDAVAPRTVHYTDTNILEMRKRLIKDFIRMVMASGKKCANCQAPAVTLKADKRTRMFMKPVSRATTKSAAGFHGFPNVLAQVADLDRANLPDAAGADEQDGVDESSLMAQASSLVRPDRDPAASVAGIDGGSAGARSDQLRFLIPQEVRAHMRLLFHHEAELCNQLFGALRRRADEPVQRVASFEMFFMKVLPVPPSRFRPMGFANGRQSEHPQNVYYSKIIETNRELALLSRKPRPERTRKDNESMINGWTTLQSNVNFLLDNKDAPPSAKLPPGIAQVLEKKEGLFRRNMMGKRVNQSARTVLSPDPFIGTHEVGLPLYFAMSLSFPEPVMDRNFEYLAQCVVNGPMKYPGAVSITDERGFTIDLKHLSEAQRIAEAKKLRLTHSRTDSRESAFSTKIVRRHLRDGDFVLMNRQPTLHKPSIMAHSARVLKREKTLRLHYANCAQYNADFDGDEMNVHLPQDQIARAEAQEIANADLQYIVPRDGGPIRGLIQDNVGAGVLLTKRDTFFEREDFTQMLYSSVVDVNGDHPIEIPAPAVMKPRELWTGKQLVSCVIKQLSVGFQPINLDSKSKTPESAWGVGSREATLIIRNNELLCGVLDKSQFGAGAYGLVHATYELLGPHQAGQLLTTLSRLFIMYFQSCGFTCGIDDCMVTAESDVWRQEALSVQENVGRQAAAQFADCDENDDDAISRAVPRLLARGEREVANLDNLMKSSLQKVTSKVISQTIPGGQLKPFPINNLSLMTVTGAKGSVVNFSQISCLLGQQELEGKRVPRMPSGRTLPSFRPYDMSARAGGYIMQRFLTGLKPQEYYFHCMAGREGLVDTAVKTSRSGYLQRCIIKHLEGLHVNYDRTVRDHDGSIYQFMYGDDGLDNSQTKYMTQFEFYAMNMDPLEARYGYRPTKQEQDGIPISQRTVPARSTDIAHKARRSIIKARSKKTELPDPVLSMLNPEYHIGAVAESFADALDAFCEKQKNAGVERAEIKRLKLLMNGKYEHSLVHSGEPVGVLAAQSIGEPSTQMTLNTFHLAGQGAANVTLGIPRLREIIMTASRSIATPAMTIYLTPKSDSKPTKEECIGFARELYRLSFSEVVDRIRVSERLVSEEGILRRCYDVNLELKDVDTVFRNKTYALEPQELLHAFETSFLALFSRQLEAALKRRSAAAEVGNATGADDGATAGVGADAEAGDDERAAKQSAPDDLGSSQQKNRNRHQEAGEYGADDADAMSDAAPPRGEPDESETDADVGDEVMLEAGDRSTLKAAAIVFNDRDRSHRTTAHRQFPRVVDYSFDSSANGFEFSVELPPASSKLLMLPLVERVTEHCVVKAVKGLSKSFVFENDGNWVVQTEGVNLREMWNRRAEIDVARLSCNDIYQMLITYGVEAARAHIVEQTNAVFQVYGITVDPRHLGLIADYMTFEGGYRPFNRQGITANPSPFQKMSFETTLQFVTEAALFSESDELTSPSARVVLGRTVKSGTGICEIVAPLA